MEIKRPTYLEKLIGKMNNKMIKVITGIRRSGKSYLLDPIFKNYLLSQGVKEDHIIKLELDSIEYDRLTKDALTLYSYIMDKAVDDDTYYILLDEIQKVKNFESLLNSLLRKRNLDVYVTGSNSKFLSSDIISEFRGRGDEVRVYPLTYKEFYECYNDKENALDDYLVYGGMPYILYLSSDEEKAHYLDSLFKLTYMRDIIERYHIEKDDVLETITNILSSSIGSLTNPKRLAETIISKGYKQINRITVNSYVNYLLDAFIIDKAERYDIKGNSYINTPSKYFFTDLGLRNARLNFRDLAKDHLMENLIYNELVSRGYSVDIGVIDTYEKNKEKVTIRKEYEVDFVCNKGNKRYYIQSAYPLPSEEKINQEQKSLLSIKDNYRKIIIVNDKTKPWYNEKGILVIGLEDFLLNEDAIDY